MTQSKIAIIDDSVISESALKHLHMKFEVGHYSRLEFISNRRQIFEGYQIIWIHVETLLLASDVEFINENTIIVTTSTGTTHIAAEIVSLLESRLISLKLEPDFLRTITSTAELAMTFILMALTGIQTAKEDVSKGNWNRRGNIRSSQVSNVTIGIIGYGRLGKILASFLRPMKPRIIIWDIDYQKRKQASEDGLIVSSSLEELLSASDVASIHASVNPNQGAIIHQGILGHAKPGLVLVNTSRGSLVSEEDIFAAIESELIHSYWTDVLFCEESGTELSSSKLWQESLNNSRICITPHIGGASRDAIEKCEMQLAKRLIAYLVR